MQFRYTIPMTWKSAVIIYLATPQRPVSLGAMYRMLAALPNLTDDPQNGADQGACYLVDNTIRKSRFQRWCPRPGALAWSAAEFWSTTVALRQPPANERQPADLASKELENRREQTQIEIVKIWFCRNR